MANFEQAIKWLQEGKKVTRDNCEWYAEIINSIIIFNSKKTNKLWNIQFIHTFDLNSNSWEIYYHNKDRENLKIINTLYEIKSLVTKLYTQISERRLKN